MVEVVERARDGSVFAPMACDGAASGECGRFSTSADMVNEAERQKERHREAEFSCEGSSRESRLWISSCALSLKRGSKSCLFGVVVGRRVGSLDPRASYSARSSRVHHGRGGGYNNKLSGSRVASCRPPLTSSREWRGGYLELSGQARVQASMEETRIHGARRCCRAALGWC